MVFSPYHGRSGRNIEHFRSEIHSSGFTSVIAIYAAMQRIYTFVFGGSFIKCRHMMRYLLERLGTTPVVDAWRAVCLYLSPVSDP